MASKATESYQRLQKQANKLQPSFQGTLHGLLSSPIYGQVVLSPPVSTKHQAPSTNHRPDDNVYLHQLGMAEHTADLGWRACSQSATPSLVSVETLTEMTVPPLRHSGHYSSQPLRGKIVQGHFTQMEWKSSKEPGVGIAKRHDGKIYVVANYLPPGNCTGQFQNNCPCAVNDLLHCKHKIDNGNPPYLKWIADTVQKIPVEEKKDS